MRIKKLVLALSIIIVMITSSISYAYFNSTVKLEGSNQGVLQKLSITNGNSKVTINTENSKWSYNPQEPEDLTGKAKVYFKKPENWGNDINIYIYDKNQKIYIEWPGIKMNSEGNNLYSYVLPTISELPEGWEYPAKIIFNQDSNQIPASQQEGFNLNLGEIKIYDNEWKDYLDESVHPEGDVPVESDSAIIKNPTSNTNVTYDNVIVKNESNLSSKIKLNLDIYGEKEGGSEEDTNIPPIIDGDISVTIPEGAKAFDVLVGDVDNLNLGGYGNKDPFLGQEMDVHGIDVFPNENDPAGTDRRMVTTGFYNFYNSIKGNTANFKTIYYVKRTYDREWPLQWSYSKNKNATFYGIVHLQENGQWTQESIFYDEKNTHIIQSNIDKGEVGNKIGVLQYEYNGILRNGDRGEIFFDGYTERAMTKTTASGDQKDDVIVQGKNYAELQPVEPITFNYSDKLEENEKVYSAVFQIMIDDLQAAPSQELWKQKKDDYDWITSFSPKSTAQYTVTLKDVNTGVEIEIPEFSTVINNLTQHGPKSNLVTLTLPQKYHYIIESGRIQGLQLKIDDTTFGTAGDTYCIDFAKLLVNQQIENKARVFGTVTDVDGKAIKNAIVTNTNTGEQVLTDENGYYEFKYVSLGQTVIQVEHKNYETEMKTIYSIAEGSQNKIDFVLKQLYNETPISPNTKFVGNVIIEKFNGNDEKIGESIVQELEVVECGEESKVTISTEELLIEPNFYYKIKYDLSLFNITSVDPNSAQFKLRFKSNISAKITQENNPGWSENGD